MKKYFKIILVCIILGGGCAFLFYKDINNEVRAVVKKDEIINIFQVGVFKDSNNAKKFASTFRTSKIYESDGFYRVIISTCYSKSVVERLESMYKMEGINYYIKEIRVSKEQVNKIKEYENIIIKSDKKEVIDSVINSMLNII